MAVDFVDQLMMDSVIDPDDGETSLHTAAYLGDVNTVRAILEKEDGKENLNRPIRPLSSTPLRLACSRGSMETVQELLKYGADVDFPDIKMQTPLFVSVHKGHLECCKTLLRAGANPNGNSRNLSTPLHSASFQGHAHIMQLLLQYGAALTANFVHPVHLAASGNYLYCFIIFLLFGTVPYLMECEKHLRPMLRILTESCEPTYLHLWVLFGGCLPARDETSEEIEANPSSNVLIELRRFPLSLKCQCRIQIWRSMGVNPVQKLSKLELPKTLITFLAYRDIPAVDDCVSDLRKEGVDI